MAEEFKVGIICKGMAGLQNHRVDAISRESSGLSGLEPWPSGELGGMELLPAHQPAFTGNRHGYIRGFKGGRTGCVEEAQ